MKLASVATPAGPRPVAIVEERFLDLCAADGTLPTTLREILADPHCLTKIAAAVRKAGESGLEITGDLLAPIANPEKVICIGLNYRDHAAESGVAPPSEPICFSKFASAITGPNAPVRLPAVCKEVDYEAELVVVIGKKGRKISKALAWDYVAGYMNGNDVSARDWQLNKPGKQWMMGKTPDTFAPIGPYLVTKDEIPNPGQLQIQLRLNGNTMQNSSTKELIFPIDELIAYLSQIFTLQPGDLIFTGTPPGVGMARKPPVLLQPGDKMEVEIAGLGVLKNSVTADE